MIDYRLLFIVANIDKDFTESRRIEYNVCDIHYFLKGTELFIIPNVQALNIPYSFTVTEGGELDLPQVDIASFTAGKAGLFRKS